MAWKKFLCVCVGGGLTRENTESGMDAGQGNKKRCQEINSQR